MATQNNTSKLTKFGFFAMTASLFVTVYEYPTFAASGKTLIFFLILCGLFWFVPVALSSTELATIKGYEQGGIFSWVGKPLGEKYGFAAIFFQWFQITVGFVTMIYFIIGTASDIFDIPIINNNPTVKFICVIAIFWSITLLQFRGTQMTSKIAKLGFTFGIILPVCLMIILTLFYFYNGAKVSSHFTQSSFWPSSSSWPAFTAFVLAYMGVEASAPHIKDLDNPSKNYPMIMVALVVVGIAVSTLGGSIVSMVLPGTISANQGVVDTLRTLVGSQKYFFVIVGFGCLVCFGVIAQVSSWIVSPTEGLRFAASKGLLPASYNKVNKYGIPVKLLIIQGFIVTIWAALLTFSNTQGGSNISFTTAISLTVVIYLCAYILFFIAYFVVIFKKQSLERDFEVPGGIVGKTLVATLGLGLSLVATCTAFMIPSGMTKQEGSSYITLLIGAIVVTIALPFIFYSIYSKKRNQGVESTDNQTKN